MKSAVVIAGLALVLAPGARAQNTIDLTAVGNGRALYVSHCVGCHGAYGVDVNGSPVERGQVAGPDLARIAARDGSFNPLHVANHITGIEGPNPHRTMPLWKSHLRDEWPADDRFVVVKVHWLTKYLDSVQVGAAR
jgi:mono/diheme cytochrome c family protein